MRSLISTGISGLGTRVPGKWQEATMYMQKYCGCEFSIGGEDKVPGWVISAAC